jgi:hypothetical protein
MAAACSHQDWTPVVLRKGKKAFASTDRKASTRAPPTACDTCGHDLQFTWCPQCDGPLHPCAVNDCGLRTADRFHLCRRHFKTHCTQDCAVDECKHVTTLDSPLCIQHFKGRCHCSCGDEYDRDGICDNTVDGKPCMSQDKDWVYCAEVRTRATKDKAAVYCPRRTTRGSYCKRCWDVRQEYMVRRRK